MSRLNTAFTTLRTLASCMVESPRSTIEAIKLMPGLIQGLQFSKSRGFRPAPKSDEPETVAANPLRVHFDSLQTGPGLWKWHHYFDIYHRHFAKFVGREVHVVEVGIYSGGSLGMWRKYFGPQCRIYGVDIEPACMSYKTESIDVFIGDQSDRAFWTRFREQVPKIDILIDDGGHSPEQQRITLEEMLSHIQPGGVYLCEDIGSEGNRFGGYASGCALGLNAVARVEEVFDAPIIPNPFQASIRSVTAYPFVSVIEKHDLNPNLFVSEKRGTEWQPY